MSSTLPVKRACDACHRRKIRCTGGQPCRNCGQASLSCTYNAVPQKKGPKGSRAKVLSELRETQRPSEFTLKIRKCLDSGFDLGSPPMSPTFLRRPCLLSQQMIDGCIDFFFAHMYPTMPILHRGRLQQKAVDIDTSTETYCLITSLCAFMMIQPGMKLAGSFTPNGENLIQGSATSGTALLEEVLRVRKGCDFIETPNVEAVITSFFLFGCYFGLDKHNTAWFYLREATTLAQIIGMQDESNYLAGDVVENTRKRRLFWLLFITERAYALQRHRPLTLHATIDLPTLDEDSNETVTISGFLHLVNLFRPFDDTFVGLWNKARNDCSTAWLAQLQQQLADALPACLNSTESQAADLKTSQQWLRTMVWQLSITNGYLSSAAPDASMTFRYPIEIARDLVSDTSRLSLQSMEVHGIGLVEKLFDIACTLTDVMSCVPLDSTTLELGPRDYLNQFLTLISTLRGGDSRFLPLLLAKVNDALPSMAAPIAQLPAAIKDERVEELYESSTNSTADSTPFEAPSLATTSGSDIKELYNATAPVRYSSAPQFGGPVVAAPMPRSVPRMRFNEYLS